MFSIKREAGFNTQVFHVSSLLIEVTVTKFDPQGKKFPLFSGKRKTFFDHNSKKADSIPSPHF